MPEMRAFMLRAGQEALDATVGLGNPVLPIFGLTADALSEPGREVETLLETLLAGFVMPDSKTTILQDWIKHRRSEADDINGLVVRTLGGSAPANRAVVEFAHRIERGELEPGVGNLTDLLAFEAASQAHPPRR
jgi:2-dehydropantoate 2-reductase